MSLNVATAAYELSKANPGFIGTMKDADKLATNMNEIAEDGESYEVRPYGKRFMVVQIDVDGSEYCL